MTRCSIVVAVAVVALGCGAQTPQQEAGSFLEGMAGCIEQNRADLIAAMDSGEQANSPEAYENMCGMDRDALSPEAQALVEEHGRVAFGEVLRTVMAGAFASAFAGGEPPNALIVDGMIDAFSAAAESAQNDVE